MAKPEIRLKGFKGEWCIKPINRIASLKAGKSFNKNDAVDLPTSGYYPCYGGNGQRGYVPYYNQDGKYNIIGRQGALCGCVNIAEGRFYATEHAVLVTPIVDIDFNFLHESLVRANINQYATGAAQPGISVANVNAQLYLNIPTLDEQKALGDFFKSLDSMIQGVTKKIASLKQMKQACLVSMFPQAGETTPRVRFKGFEGEWEKKILNDCLDISHEKNLDNRYGKNDVLSVSDDCGVMNQIELLGRSYAGKSVSNYGVLNNGEIVYTKSPLKSKPYGIVKMNTGKTGIVSVLYAIYVAKENTSTGFIHYYFDPAWRLNAYLLPLVNKGAKNTMNISDEMALTGYIMIPKDIREQQKIATYFTSLDKQISLQEARLEKLKQIKSACLDKMFV